MSSLQQLGKDMELEAGDFEIDSESYNDMYAEWLTNKPEAGICNGDTLQRRMEADWGGEEFRRTLGIGTPL